MSLDVYLKYGEDEVFSFNITHNVNVIAMEAGCYMPLWRPEEIGIIKAKDLIEPLQSGLDILISDPEKYEQLNPKNGWGSYGSLLVFMAHYLQACKRFPEADVFVSR